MTAADSFPRHSARTQGFTLGAPRNITVTPDGERVLFLRSSSGTDRSNALWRLDVGTASQHPVADPAQLRAEDTVSPEEQARRERARERATGITGYATDRDARRVAFTLSGELFLADLDADRVRPLSAAQPAGDPRPSPDGAHIAYVANGALRLIGSDGTGDRALAEPTGEHTRWGQAEFIAAEEMNRGRGYWWSPDGSAILAAHVDESPVALWHLADPAEPAGTPATMRYPAAGTANAEVTLAVVPVAAGAERTEVRWDRERFPYLVAAHWSPYGPPLLAVQTRDQRVQLLLSVDASTGETTEIHRETDPHWVEIKTGWPAWTPQGQLVRITALDGAYRLMVDDQDRTGDHLQVRSILDIGEHDILVLASEDDPAQVHVHRVDARGTERLTPDRGVHIAARGGRTTVLSSATLDALHPQLRVFDGTEQVATIESNAQTPQLRPNIGLLRGGERRLRSALLLPEGHRPEHGRLPVLLDPYGGPQAQRVLDRQQGYLSSQWFAEQGYAVIITDGRGMTGRGPEWDRAIAGDLAGPPLQDQVDALHAIAAEHPVLDLDRVAIRGWSFGGYLAALAVLRRPDVFHAAIAGAPVCDWRLYDTHYTERYLGDPTESPQAYAASSLLADAAELDRPLLLIHGTVDDNVVPAHSLRLSAALTAAARPHSMLPLPGVTHMPTSESTTENLLLLQSDFLRKSLRQS